jgi:hypothetical protein
MFGETYCLKCKAMLQGTISCGILREVECPNGCCVYSYETRSLRYSAVKQEQGYTQQYPKEEKTEQPSLLEQRIAALEAEVAFLKNLPPSLMESLGYKKI